MPDRITSLDNPRVRQMVALRRSRNRRREGCFIAEGPREVVRAIEAGLDVLEVFTCAAMLREPIDLGSLRPDLPRFEVTADPMRKMAYREEPEGVLARVREPRWTWQHIDARAGDAPLLLVATGLTKPGNLGAMARTASAAGACAMLVIDSIVDAFNPNAIRASTGAVFTLPVLECTTDQALSELSQRHVGILAADPDATCSYDHANMRCPTAIVIGAEDRGLPDAWLHPHPSMPDLHQCIRIPTADSLVDSLNASNAAAILLFEAVRQRRAALDDHVAL